MTMGVAAITWWSVMLLLATSASASSQCELVEERRANDLVSVSFDFWYAVGVQESNVLDDTTNLFNLEQLIYTSIDAKSLWCTKVAKDTNTTAGVRRRILEESFRRLGVVTYTPGRPDQVIVDELCPEELAEQTPHCIVVKGEMSILAVEAENVPSAVKGMRQSIKDAMDSGVVLGSELSGVEFLWYLGNRDTNGVVLLKAISGAGVVGFGMAMKIGVPLLAVLFVIVALLFVPNKRQRTAAVSFSERKDGLGVLPPVTLSTLRGTADHPDSIHQGSFHFTPQGQHYLSTNCSKCLATRQDYFYFRDPATTSRSNASSEFWNGDVMSPRLGDNMATILEDQPLGGGSRQEDSASTPLPITADMKNGIANNHWGIDVHNCGSAMCTRCCTGSGRPQFCRVASPSSNCGGRPDILVDPNLRTSPVQAEV